MPDGTKFAGMSPDSGKAMYVAPDDAAGRFNQYGARSYAEAFEDHGRHDFRLPTKSELNVLFNHRAAIGGFDETSAGPKEAWYCSSSPHSCGHAVVQRFSDGATDVSFGHRGLLLRLVRG